MALSLPLGVWARDGLSIAVFFRPRTTNEWHCSAWPIQQRNSSDFGIAGHQSMGSNEPLPTQDNT
jgi:hypothetical protein